MRARRLYQSCARGRGPNTAHASLLAAAAVRGPFRSLAFAYLARMYDVADDASRAEKCRGARALSLDPADPIAGPDECAARGDDHAYVARARVATRCVRSRGASGGRAQQPPAAAAWATTKPPSQRSRRCCARRPTRAPRGRRWAPPATPSTGIARRSRRTAARLTSNASGRRIRLMIPAAGCLRP